MKNVLVLLVLLGLAVGSFSQEPLGRAAHPYVFGRGDIPTGNTPYAMVTADFNGDLKLDFAVVNLSDNSISVYLGQSDGSFIKSADYPVGVNPDAITIGDFSDRQVDDLIAIEILRNQAMRPEGDWIVHSGGEGAVIDKRDHVALRRHAHVADPARRLFPARSVGAPAPALVSAGFVPHV